MTTDRALCHAVTESGDEAAFRALYRRHTPRLHGVLCRMLGAGADADDAVQDCWVAAIRSLPSFRWDAEFRTWLIGIGINVARALLRRRGRDLALVDDLAASSGGDAEGRIDLERAIARLPAGQREVFLLHDVEGWTHDDIARHLQRSPGTSKSQLADARRRLRALLAPASLASTDD